MGFVKDGGADHLAGCLTGIADKQAAAPTATEPLGQKTSYLEGVLDAGLSLKPCRRADNGAQWAYGQTIELP